MEDLWVGLANSRHFKKLKQLYLVHEKGLPWFAQSRSIENKAPANPIIRNTIEYISK